MNKIRQNYSPCILSKRNKQIDLVPIFGQCSEARPSAEAHSTCLSIDNLLFIGLFLFEPYLVRSVPTTLERPI